VTNEIAQTLIAVAWQYRHSHRPLPEHVVADLLEVAGATSIAVPLRSDARRLLNLEAA
jgi:hypothetical protein